MCPSLSALDCGHNVTRSSRMDCNRNCGLKPTLSPPNCFCHRSAARTMAQELPGTCLSASHLTTTGTATPGPQCQLFTWALDPDSALMLLRRTLTDWAIISPAPKAVSERSVRSISRKALWKGWRFPHCICWPHEPPSGVYVRGQKRWA